MLDPLTIVGLATAGALGLRALTKAPPAPSSTLRGNGDGFEIPEMEPVDAVGALVNMVKAGQPAPPRNPEGVSSEDAALRAADFSSAVRPRATIPVPSTIATSAAPRIYSPLLVLRRFQL